MRLGIMLEPLEPKAGQPIPVGEDQSVDAAPFRVVMPTISMFYGIIVALMYEDNDRHHLPHFHVRYQDFKASIAIEDGRVLAGKFPPKQLKLVQAWVELHREDLFADWTLALNGEEPFRIAPLQ